MRSERHAYRLTDIIELIGGGTPKTNIPKYWNGNIPWLSVKDFNNNDRYVYSTEKSITQAGLDNSSTKMLVPDDIIISARGTVGELAMIPSPMAFNQSCYGIRGRKDIISQPYLYYFLKDSIRLLKSQIHGSVFDTITRNTFENIKINLPPIEVQIAIAAVLSALDDKIELNNRINRNLEAQAQAIFKSWFVDFEPFRDGEFVDSELGLIPKGWRVGTLGNLIDSTLGGDWGKDTPLGNYTEEVYCIRGADIPEISKGNQGKMPTRFILPKNLASKQLCVNDIVIEISGGSPTQSTGRCVLISQPLLARYSKKIICTNFCRAIKPIGGYSIFIYYMWKYLYEQGVMFSYENGTTGIKNLDINSFLANEEIIIPPKNILGQFDLNITAMQDMIFAMSLENEKLAEIRDTLLPKLMSGEILVPLEV